MADDKTRSSAPRGGEGTFSGERLHLPACSTILACLCLVLAGCADVGEPVYPSAKIPVAPNDLVAIERGDHIAVQFTASSYTTEVQLITELRGAEVRVGPARQPFNAAAWAKSAEECSLTKPAEKPGPVQASCPASALVGSDVVVGARVLNIKGRPSAWSNFVPVHVQPPVPAPVDVSAAAVPDGVRLTWSDPDVRSFVVFRQSAADKQPAQLGRTDQPAISRPDHSVRNGISILGSGTARQR